MMMTTQKMCIDFQGFLDWIKHFSKYIKKMKTGKKKSFPFWNPEFFDRFGTEKKSLRRMKREKKFLHPNPDNIQTNASKKKSLKWN